MEVVGPYHFACMHLCWLIASADHESCQDMMKYLENIRVNSFTMKMEILLEPTSNKLMVEHAEFDESNANVLERFYTSAGNPVKEILLKLNLPDHRYLIPADSPSADSQEFITTCHTYRANIKTS
ncbi:hypothetical protein Tco_1516165 [Tanacetum coccineum]